MYTLIPEKTAKFLKKEYRLRATILLFLFMSLGIWVGIIALFPSYFVSIQREKIALTQVGAVEQITQSASTTTAIAEISAANSAITKVAQSQDQIMVSSIVEDIASRRVPGVSITDFEIGRAGGTATNIVIHGIASTRNAIVTFKNNLDSDNRFSKVDLPVSDLAASSNITFSMSLTGLQ